MTTRANSIALAVLNRFETLPQKRKPLVRSNGHHEWVPLSGIVAEKDGEMTCLALATGMKCLPSAKLSESNGVAIHDWHAEILALRTFNRFLLDECLNLSKTDGLSGYVSKIDVSQTSNYSDAADVAPPFVIQDGIKLHMYCSEAPCGDASMELTMAAQDDASPWAAPVAESLMEGSDSSTILQGRAHFDRLGVVRRKPGRGDAPPTLSKSCSDKLALKQCTSLLSSLTSLFINPAHAYIDTLVLPQSQYSASGCKRAFSAEGRMQPLVGKQWPGGYAFKPFTIEASDIEFRYSKRSVQARASSISASNLATAWSLSGVEETLIGGVLQGRKAFDIRGASQTSKRQMWVAASEIAARQGDPTAAAAAQRHLNVTTYREVKDGPLLVNRRAVKAEVRKEALGGWIRNEGGSDFSINHAM